MNEGNAAVSKYPCTGCGQCCRQLGRGIDYFMTLKEGEMGYREIREFPYHALPSGVCEMLQPDNTCAVYHNRPALCNSETIRERYFPEDSELTYHIRQMMACNIMIRQAGLPAGFLVKLNAPH